MFVTKTKTAASGDFVQGRYVVLSNFGGRWFEHLLFSGHCYLLIIAVKFLFHLSNDC